MKLTRDDCLKMQEICKGYIQAYTTNQPQISTFVANKSLIFQSEIEAQDIENRLIKSQEARFELLKKKMQQVYSVFFNYANECAITKEELQQLSGILLSPCDNTEDHPFSRIDMEYQVICQFY